MNTTLGDVNEFLSSVKLGAEVFREVTQQDGFIHVFSHLDADGVAAGGIIGKALYRLGAKFRVRVTQWVDERIVSEVIADKPDLVVLADFGSGYLNLLNEKLASFKVLVLDHHQPLGEACSNVVHVNPHLHGIDGANDVSGSGVAYFTVKALNPENIDLSPIALVGALGDMQDKYDQRKLGGLNQKIVEDALNASLVKVEKDLILFGRETRPIHKALTSTTNPFIPGISGEEDKTLAFLSSLGIKTKENERWRALRDLSEEEKRKLCSALAEHLLSMGLHFEATNLIGEVYILLKEEPWTPLRDAREFAVVLNSTGRMDRPSLGIALCMGDRGAALEEANTVLEEYRRSINKYLSWVMEKPGCFEELENIYVIHGENFINEKIIGTVSSIMAMNLPNAEKPLIAYAHVEDQGVAKFSARTTDRAIRRGINLGEIMHAASMLHGGNGGGHNIAAGGQVSIEKTRQFIQTVNELVGKQLKGERLAG
jgi:RecJ-like exonuclease